LYYTNEVNQDEFFVDPNLAVWFIRAEPSPGKIGAQIGLFFDYNVFRCSQAGARQDNLHQKRLSCNADARKTQ
jgi:hypothetical protein